MEKILLEIYDSLYKEFGSRHWWPGETPFEVSIGAILTQNTAWTNVEKAINRLKEHNLLSPECIRDIDINLLGEMIRSSGYYNQKAKKLKAFINFLFSKYEGSMEKMAETEMWTLRHELLQINGIGMETADSILLYACYKPIFVVDAYTIRFLSRHKLIKENETSYTHIQKLFMNNLPTDVTVYNEYHALIVQLGKELCSKTNPRCDHCPLSFLTG
ncbi:endonuclease III domain-containing protein [Candidatus Desantisbacteria bacterium]|nr:endonuclease III domain-containing protein [Candidatus Desantisbacteria bacterium]